MESFKGNVRHIAESLHEVRPGRLRRANGRVTLRMEKNFDRQGNLVEERYRKRKHINRITYKYDSQGNCVERFEFNFDHVLFFRYRYKYDRWGHQIAEECYNPDGSLSHSRSSRYNSKGEMVEKRIRRGESNENVRLTYDENGNVVEEVAMTNGKFSMHHNYKYDAQGNKVEETTQHADLSSSASNWDNRYDQEGRIVEQIIRRDGDNDFYAHYQFEYDALGRRICTKCQNSDSVFSIRRLLYDDLGRKSCERWQMRDEYSMPSLICGERQWRYDEQGRLASETVLSGPLVAHQQELIENEEGVLVQVRFTGKPTQITYRTTYLYAEGETPTSIHDEQFDANGSLVESRRRRFNEQGDLLEEHQIEQANGSTHETRECYSYDSSGNWTQKECFYDGQLAELVTREIEYWVEEA